MSIESLGESLKRLGRDIADDVVRCARNIEIPAWCGQLILLTVAALLSFAAFYFGMPG